MEDEGLAGASSSPEIHIDALGLGNIMRLSMTHHQIMIRSYNPHDHHHVP